MEQPARTLWAVTAVAVNRASLDATVKPTSMTASPVRSPVSLPLLFFLNEYTADKPKAAFSKDLKTQNKSNVLFHRPLQQRRPL